MRTMIPIILALGLAVTLIWFVDRMISHGSEVKTDRELVLFLEYIVMGFLLVGMICDKALKYMAYILNALLSHRQDRQIETIHSDYTHQFIILFCATIASVAIFIAVSKVGVAAN
jgi:hypothetical protein